MLPSFPSFLCLGRRRLLSGEDPCGIEAIIAACNEAFEVTTCRCVQHSDGGCPVSLDDVPAAAGSSTETAVTGTTSMSQSLGIVDRTTAEQEDEQTSTQDSSEAPNYEEIDSTSSGDSFSATPPVSLQTVEPRPEEELATAEVGADGRVLQEVGQGITTDLEMTFTTDVEVRPVNPFRRTMAFVSGIVSAPTF